MLPALSVRPRCTFRLSSIAASVVSWHPRCSRGLAMAFDV
jgi:hypothetical protein